MCVGVRGTDGFTSDSSLLSLLCKSRIAGVTAVMFEYLVDRLVGGVVVGEISVVFWVLFLLSVGESPLDKSILCMAVETLRDRLPCAVS